MPASGRVTFAGSGGIHVLRYHGRVDYMLAPPVRRLTQGVIATGDVAGAEIAPAAASCLEAEVGKS